jgi:predicted O-linked N-acetylglucosamine transferase (SPINDLY family)
MTPLPDVLAVADRFHRFGALAPAERLYREALQGEPDNAEVWCRLGDVCQALGRHGEAVGSYHQALALRPDYVRAHNNLGVALMEQGRLDAAAASYREALRLQPDHAEAHNNLGIALMGQGRLDEAAASYAEALRLKPAYPAAHNNLGHARAQQGRLAEAAACCQEAVRLQPDFAPAWAQLGDVLRGLGRPDEAAACYERAGRLRPGDAGPPTALGTLLLELGRPEEAVACYERALRLRPESPAACSNLGLALLHLGRADEAAVSFRQALHLQPDLAEAHNNLGLAVLNLGRAEQAVLSFGEALRLRPGLADAHNNLGLALAACGQPDEALACYERAVRLQPDHFGALTNLGNACKDQGRLGEAVACYRNVVAVRPEDARAHSNLLLALNYQPGADPAEIRREANAYAERHAAPLTAAAQPHPVRSLEGRRLRIGYVSADFREHPVAYFLEPILAAHDHQRFEVCCYADVGQPDAVTRRLQGYADQWRSLVGLSDEQAAEVVRQDGIDVLVDLSGHTGGNRLLVFAHKPAPVQASYLGYLGTTGLPAIDYYITDAHADPLGLTEAHFQEQLVRLPECGFCYQPGPAPDVSPDLPARQSGRVTFGCLNTLAKVSAEVLALWAWVLAAVPGSRIVLPTGGRHAEERVRATLVRNGVAPERVLLLDRAASRFDYLQRYHGIDLCLDPFPYHGVTTTCDALWMGVPVLTLAGRTCVSRQGVRFLRTVGLDELIADTPEDYVRVATELAGDLPRLAALHAGLRERMRRSPLLDARQFTKDLEEAYAAMWERWVSRERTA